MLKAEYTYYFLYNSLTHGMKLVRQKIYYFQTDSIKIHLEKDFKMKNFCEIKSSNYEDD